MARHRHTKVNLAVWKYP